LSVPEQELVFTAAKEVLIKALEVGVPLELGKRGDKAVGVLGDRFSTLVSKMASSFRSLKD